MAIGDLTRINTNIAAFNALNSLKNIGNQLGVTQLRLQTGKRINEAADDPAGFSVVGKLNARARGLATALDSVGTSTNMLSIAEGAMQSIHDNLLNMRDLILQATSNNLGSDERTAIEQQLDDLTSEIGRLRDATTFNGQKLLDGTFTGKRVLTGSETTDTILVSISQDFDPTSTTGLGLADASMDVSTAALASTSLSYVDTALGSVRSQIQNVGSVSSRLRSISDNLSVAVTNTKAAASRVQDADVAAEQVNAVRLQILQQLATAQLTQANSGPQQVLALFR
ncbi:flagellin [Candidatus Methylomirabilis sp.]|uniref:flagellin n=1 Tax=Candidatus Methylomirabilis sp. TaxID=2032687 RepID=UPI002A61C431|nr:flagellin [Candidatus Methylomirabilis sp.]